MKNIKLWRSEKPTGNWFENGKLEIGNFCEHSHKSIAAAEKCATKNGNGWRVGEIEKIKNIHN